MTGMYGEAEKFLRLCYKEWERPDRELEIRLAEVKEEIAAEGTYTHTAEELEMGARLAWRNSNRCIGRLFWDTLHVMDERKLVHADDIYEALLKHIRYATNGGKIRPAITIFKPHKHGEAPFRIWNHQLVRYAGYRKDGYVIGDPASIELTEYCLARGWSGSEGAFDVLPLVIQAGDEEPELFPLPGEEVMEVPIRHQDLPAFSNLNIKWYAVPIISDMRLEIGGISYTAAPFNGWYMGTEIGARNLADKDRYNLLPQIAEIMGLDISSNRTLWKDKALVELNLAVLDSFQKQGVSIVDHHTAAQQFKSFEKNEEKAERKTTGDWTWLIPPVSPATTHIFHRPYRNEVQLPNYFYQKKLYK